MNSIVNYNIFLITYIHLFLYFGGLFFNHPLFSMQELFFRYVGTLAAYNLYDLVIKKKLDKYNVYVQNMANFGLLVFFQNIAVMAYSRQLNFNKTLMYLFVFVLLDILLDVNIKDGENNKIMYMDILRLSICYYMVETISNEKLNKRDYIYLIILVLSKYFFYKYVDEELKNIVFHN